CYHFLDLHWHCFCFTLLFPSFLSWDCDLFRVLIAHDSVLSAPNSFSRELNISFSESVHRGKNKDAENALAAEASDEQDKIKDEEAGADYMTRGFTAAAEGQSSQNAKQQPSIEISPN
ncbi:hypothetical protein BHE74_00058730, partial [Ensete ventricosum]